MKILIILVFRHLTVRAGCGRVLKIHLELDRFRSDKMSVGFQYAEFIGKKYFEPGWILKKTSVRSSLPLSLNGFMCQYCIVVESVLNCLFKTLIFTSRKYVLSTLVCGMMMLMCLMLHTIDKHNFFSYK